jgi:hypothetical protein
LNIHWADEAKEEPGSAPFGRKHFGRQIFRRLHDENKLVGQITAPTKHLFDQLFGGQMSLG